MTLIRLFNVGVYYDITLIVWIMTDIFCVARGARPPVCTVS
jgi:hypothetical protein